MKFYWFNKKCCVPECFNSSTEGEGCYKEFFDLPAEPHARARWLKAILSDDGENLKICEDHFKDDDVFRDKNHRKKLRLNSIPSTKLPQNICTACLGQKKSTRHSDDYAIRMCQCFPATATATVTTTSVNEVSPEKRTRLTWTSEEKRVLFKAIRKHGDVKVVNRTIRINWNNVLTSYRNNGCFGNEKELKTTWQNLRIRALKVYRNEIYGTKLERKVSRFLYGKGPKLNRVRAPPANKVDGATSHPANMDVGTSDDEFYEEQTVPNDAVYQDHEELEDDTKESPNTCTEQEDEHLNDNTNNNIDKFSDEEEKKVEITNNSVMTKTEDSDSESEDEYYSIEDVKNKLGIKIAPTISEVISLISSEGSDVE